MQISIDMYSCYFVRSFVHECIDEEDSKINRSTRGVCRRQVIHKVCRIKKEEKKRNNNEITDIFQHKKNCSQINMQIVVLHQVDVSLPLYLMMQAKAIN